MALKGIRGHLENHDVSLIAISRSPLDRLLAYHERMGRTFPWASTRCGVPYYRLDRAPFGRSYRWHLHDEH
jgi:hypothetical protein